MTQIRQLKEVAEIACETKEQYLDVDNFITADAYRMRQDAYESALRIVKEGCSITPEPEV